ncbi:MAG: HEPN domain-containing protein [Truepera sp.]|nr:HEPN domain-containing protein [Truepera sp.]
MSVPEPPELVALAKARENLSAAREPFDRYPGITTSRAYYAMFYAATALLLERGLSFKRHSAVIAAFGREFAKDDEVWREHHAHLVRAEELRKEGDYDLYSRIDVAEIAELLRWTEAFLQAIERRLA